MGEYADDLIDGDIMSGRWYNEDNGYEDDDNGDCEVRFTQSKKQAEPEFDVLEFKEIITESDKAWKLRMSGDAETWFSKKYCEIKGNLIFVPVWLMDKIAGW